MIAPVPVPPCSWCYDLRLLFRPWAWPSDGHDYLFRELAGQRPEVRRYVERLPAALDPSKP